MWINLCYVVAGDSEDPEYGASFSTSVSYINHSLIVLCTGILNSS